MKIGIFGGTFNPIHNGHLKSCLFVKESLKLDKILIIPTKIPVHKESINLVDSDYRIEMIRLAIENFSEFEINKIEIEREEASYSYITMQSLKKKYKKDELFLIIGVDSYQQFHTWKNPEMILNVVSLVVMDRKKSFKENSNLSQNKEKIFFIKNPVLEISSTTVRELIKEKKDVSEFLSENIINYIKTMRLYQN